MITVTETVDIQAPAERAFAYVDDIRNVGSHMTERSSMAMMGSRLKLEILSKQVNRDAAALIADEPADLMD